MAENLFRQIDRDRADRDRAARDPGPRPHLLGDPESSLKKPVQKRPGRAGTARRFVGLLGLAEDLGLADDHRVEPGCDPKKMLHAMECFVAIKGIHFLLLRRGAGGEQAICDALGRDRVLGRGIDFHPVAGGEEERLGAAHFFAQNAIDFGVAGKALPYLHVGGVVAEADTEEVH